MADILNAAWKLKRLDIQFQTYGDYKGKYVGKIEFDNRENEAFMFNMTPEDTQRYIELVSEKLVNSASHLGDKLLASLNLLPAPKTIQIESAEQQPDVQPIQDIPDDLPF